MKVAHIVNVTEINESKKASYLHFAQPITMKSMVIAREIAKNVIDVSLVAVKHKDEVVDIPVEFKWATDLETYAWEHNEVLRDVLPRKPLPRLKDIIKSLYDSSDAEYFIYTNLDIGLYPHFYLKIKEIIDSGYDAAYINRRDLEKEYNGVLLTEENIELIFGLEGSLHGGIDCLLFRREVAPLLNLGNVYVGFPPIGKVLKTQIEMHSRNFLRIKCEKLTFHVGKDQPWKKNTSPYGAENWKMAEGLYVNRSDRNCYTRTRRKLRHVIRKCLMKDPS